MPPGCSPVLEVLLGMNKVLEEDCGKEGEEEKKYKLFKAHAHSVSIYLELLCRVLFVNVSELFIVTCKRYVHACVQYAQRPQEGIHFPGSGGTCGCEPPCVCWALSPGPPEKQPGLFPWAVSPASGGP